MSRLRFVEAENAEQRNVARACELLEVSRSAFYDWHQHRPSLRQLADEALGERIQAIFDASRGTYGWPRVHQALRREGIHASRKRVARIMRQKGLVGRCRRRWTKTTVSDPETRAVDLVKRAFGPGTVEVDRVYVGDITYIWTWEGWLYLATVIDLASRRVVGWAMADHMRTELVSDALRMAVARRRPAPGLIFHSDRGTQYTSTEFTALRSQIFNRIGNRLSPIVDQYAKEYHYTLILDSSNQATQIVYSDPAIEITDDIVKRLDASQISSKTAAPAVLKAPAPSDKKTN